MKDALSSVMNVKDNKNMTFFIIGGVLILICIIIIIYFSFFYNNGGSSYVELRNTLEKAAINYCDDNCGNLFGGVTTITVPARTLIDGGYMREFNKGDETTCDGEVVIKKAYAGYNYITDLDCGENSLKNIYDTIVENASIVDNGSGLYEMNDSKVYRGEYVDNYLKLGNTMFRIVKLNNDNTLMLVLDDYNKNTESKWDDRYNSNVKRNDGINDYSISRARETLTNIISNLYAEDIGKKAMSYDYCIGSRGLADASNDGSIECVSKFNDYISLLTVYDFINASIDGGCKSVDNSKVCQNYNYLDSYSEAFWTLTPVKDTTNDVYYYDGSSLVEDKAKTKHSLRFVITISGEEKYKSGTGTFEDPYVIYE